MCKIRRIWLASGERQLVRSDASWLLCRLIRFSAWPRAAIERCHARHDTAGTRPGFGGVAGLGEVAHGVEVADRAPGAHLVGLGEDQGVQGFVLGQAEDVLDGIFLAPIHGLAPAVVAVTADGDDGARPVPPYPAHQTAQMGETGKGSARQSLVEWPGEGRTSLPPGVLPGRKMVTTQ